MSDFEHEHDLYLKAWAEALVTGDPGDVEAYLAPDYHGWFAPSSDQHAPYDRADGVRGMRESVASLRGAGFRTGSRTFCRRGEQDAVVSYEKLIEQDGRLVAGAYIVEAWSRAGGRWLLFRELTEHGATVV